ncbi:hypothetical protein SAY87_002293 [Trapa incisa]|uniref:Chloroplast lumen common family protein n=1 Tax=Trapa incisa TaxID=236973 RepID=A0AAN7PUS5_9MYRT|nr:hypothetical protein SAY87_002293 [Trapa incisa]
MASLSSLSFSSQSNLIHHRKLLKLPPSSFPRCLRPPKLLSCTEWKIHILARSFLASAAIPSSPKEVLKPLLKKAAILLLGCSIFVGFVNKRPSLAIAAPTLETSEREELFEKLLEDDSANVEALKVVLYGKMRRGKTEEAVKYVDKLIDADPFEVEWRLLRALCYETMGQLSTAKKLFRDILEERPLLLRALHGLAMVMHKNNEGSAVFEMLYKALELARRQNRVTEERNIKILIAQMHVVKGDLDGSLKKFQDLIHDDPRDFRPYLCQGIVYSLLDKKDEAQEQFETYQSLVPEEFPQRGFLDDVVLAAKSKPQDQFWKDFETEFSSSK